MTLLYAIDWKLTLEYLKVILSFPTVTLILTLLILIIFRVEIRKLFPRLSKLGTSGIELNPVETAALIQKELNEVGKEQQPLKEAIDNLPEGKEKELIQRAQEAVEEAAQERSIAAALRQQLAFHQKTEEIALSEVEKEYIRKYVALIPQPQSLGMNHHIFDMQRGLGPIGPIRNILIRENIIPVDLSKRSFGIIHEYIKTLELGPDRMFFNA